MKRTLFDIFKAIFSILVLLISLEADFYVSPGDLKLHTWNDIWLCEYRFAELLTNPNELWDVGGTSAVVIIIKISFRHHFDFFLLYAYWFTNVKDVICWKSIFFFFLFLPKTMVLIWQLLLSGCDIPDNSATGVKTNLNGFALYSLSLRCHGFTHINRIAKHLFDINWGKSTQSFLFP